MCVSQKFMVEKVDWENDYAFEKILPLVTLYDLTNFRNSASDRGKCLRPHRLEIDTFLIRYSYTVHDFRKWCSQYYQETHSERHPMFGDQLV